MSGVDHLVDGLFKFAANLQALQLTDEQLALLCAIALISYGKDNLYQVTILNIDPLFLDRSGLKSPSSVQNLQNTMLKALNLNILMEHQHKSYELDAKIRFLECLKRLQGNQLVLTQQVSNNSSKFRIARVKLRSQSNPDADASALWRQDQGNGSSDPEMRHNEGGTDMDRTRVLGRWNEAAGLLQAQVGSRPSEQQPSITSNQRLGCVQCHPSATPSPNATLHRK